MEETVECETDDQESLASSTSPGGLKEIETNVTFSHLYLHYTKTLDF